MLVELGEIQKGIYFHCQAGEKLAYNVSTALELNGVDKEILEHSLRLLVAEQEALRCQVVMQDDSLVFDIKNDVPLNFIYINNVDNYNADKLVHDAMLVEFDLEKAPLYCLTLLQQNNGKQILVVCMHHIIADGISVDIFIKKLFKYYHSLCNGQYFKIKRNNGYSKFLNNERKKLNKGSYNRQKEYWKEKLLDASVLNLVEDYKSSSVSNGVGKEQRFVVNNDLYKKIEGISHEQEISSFMLFLSAFSVVMSKYANSDDVVVASSFSHRPELEMDSSIGCYIYTLPLRFDIKNEYSFSDILKQASANVFGAYKNIGYPNNLIANDSSLIQTIGAPSIFDITFIYDNYEIQNDEIKSIYESNVVTFPGNMMVIMQKIENETCVKFQYKPEIFSDETIELMGNRFIKLLEQIVSDISCNIGDLDLFINGEKDKIFNDINNTSYFKYIPQNIADVFEEKVSKNPNEVGVIEGNKQYTYSEINSMANQLARRIIEIKSGENDLIGIQLERSIKLVISILATIKAGCGYVPIDYTYPNSRKEYITSDTNLSAIITTHSLPWPDNIVSNILYVDDVDCFTGNSENLDIVRKADSLAYVEYTSGSTGEPKGVMIENHSVINTVLDLDRRFPLEEKDVYLLKTTYTFDIFGTELYGWIVGKGVLCILEKDGEKNPQLIIDTIGKNNITHINFVPSMFRVFLEMLENKENLNKVKSLKWIFLGGEAVTPDIIQKYSMLGMRATLENVYGPTEATMWATHYPIRKIGNVVNVSIGKPLNEYKCYIVDRNNHLLPIGVPGELCISGVGLARGYLNKEELTKDRFVDNPFYSEELPSWYKKMYKTGDLTRWLPNGDIEFLGRIDFQVKVDGVRIELGEIENAMCEYEDVIQAVAVIKTSKAYGTKICAYYMSDEEIDPFELRTFLDDKIPEHMIPQFFVHKKELPLNSSGKVNRKELMADESYLKNISENIELPENDMERLISEIWEEVLEIEQIDVERSFFTVGGNSLGLMRVHNKLQNKLKKQFPITVLLRMNTIRELAKYLSEDENENVIDRSKLFQNNNENTAEINASDIAIVGMSIDVPGAENIWDFWDVLKNGEEAIRFYTDDELRELGVSENLLKMPNFVKAKGSVGDLDYFDSKFFNISPKEVNMTSPQLRLLYKGAWEVLEDSGYDPEQFDGRIGVFLGGSDDFQWYRHSMFGNVNYSDTYQVYTLSTNHFLATRLSYKFNFNGPALSALTGCSTSLVTAHLACQSLKMNECDMAIAGGITVELPNDGGYLYEEGMMFSPDGHCRPFDANAKGTMFSNGFALVAMKRLEDAISSGDHIYAVIKGSAINNDGSNKMSYTAPSEDGQADVIRKAYQNAGIDPETIGYVEAHGTGTLLGDPIEVGSLTRAFATDKKQYCILGSLKGNIGHTDTAAGVVGLAKVGLCLDRKFIPATVNYNVPNPKINFANTPFVVKNIGETWTRNENELDIPLRAGINSFGVGGTNVHMVLEEAPKTRKSTPESEYNLLTFSAKTETALNNTIKKVIEFIADNPNVNISDIAYTLQVGRRKFEYKKSVVLDNNARTEVESILKNILLSPASFSKKDKKNVYFMFSGQGSQYQGMGKELYYGNQDLWLCREYKKNVDMLFNFLPDDEKKEFFDVLYGNADSSMINQTKYSQFSLFVTEYTLAVIMIKMGVEPVALLGHSIGEVVAAAVAGIWSVKDAVKVVRARGDLMQAQKPGCMLAVMADREIVEKYLTSNIWISLCNTTDKCVVGGFKEEIDALSDRLDTDGIKNSVIRTSHAFHTPMMDIAAEKFEKVLNDIEFNEPKYPIISNVTGKYVSNNEITDAHYWAMHIKNRILFENDLSVVLEDTKCVGIEIGAGRTLSSFANQHKLKKNGQIFVNLIRHIKENENDVKYFYNKLGKLWCENVLINICKLECDNVRNRVSVPTYVFDKISYPIRISDNTSDNSKGYDFNATDNTNDIVNIESYATEISDESVAEKYVIDAYKEVFGFEEVDLNDDFFAVGGDSLKAVSLAAVLRSALKIKIDVQDIFANTTPKQLANYIFENNDFTDTGFSITLAPSADYYALSSAQRRMYTFYLMDKDALTYNLPSATFVEGKLQKDRVIAAVQKLVQRHETLRTSFEIIDGECVQIINDNITDLPITFTESKCETDEDFEKLVSDFIKPFDLSKAPLFRFELVDIGNEKQLLLFDVHHIIADGTAVEILTRDFNAMYFGDLEPIRIQYKDFALWQNNNLNSDKMKQQEAFWLDHLSGEIPVLELPTDYERPEISDFAGSRVEFDISNQLTEKIKALAKKYSATNFMIMLSAWYILLERYSGQDDIIVGTPVSGRTQEDIRETVGMFVNMLAIRNFPVADKKYSEFIVEMKDRVLEALKNQDYQFDTLVEKMNVRRELNRSAVFDVSFDYHNMDLYDLEVEGIKFIPHEIANNAASVDLLLTCNEDNNDNLDCYIDYSTSLFKQDTIERMAAHYVKILEQIVDNQELQIGCIDIVTEKDEQILFNQFDSTKLEIDNDILVNELFERNVDLAPERVAMITDDGREFTYKYLNECANSLAWKLRSMGVTTDSFVGIVPCRNENLVIAILAVLKAGGAYVALDPKYPKDRITYMVSQCNILVTLCERKYQELTKDLTSVIYFDELKQDDKKNINPPKIGNRENIAYTIFTSGSTGMPKGVMVKQEGVVNLIFDHINKGIFGSSDDRIACIATPSFDIFGFETIIPLCSGSSLYMANEEEQLDSNMLSDKMLQFNVTHIQAPVSRLKAMVENNNFKRVLPQLKVIVGGGESYPITLAKYLQKNTSARLFNMYGPTETTITATVKELTSANKVNIGNPVANTQVFIINENNLLQPIGVFGELCIAGRGLSKGYLNKPDETENKFITLGNDNPIRVYRTGDRARLLANGEIELLGRLDTQVKIRGYRVELGEIEKIAMSFEGVAYAVAKAFSNDNGNTQLALFYSSQKDESFEDELKQLLMSKLPGYMVPSYFVCVEAMPLLPNGKVDRKALKLENNIISDKKIFKPKKKDRFTRIESEIKSIWQDVLKVSNISLRDNFFDIGGNSYGLMLVNNELNELLGYTVPLMQLFENPTIASLAKSLNLNNNSSLLELEDADDEISDETDIAVIGMNGRFPGAENIEELWDNILQGKESIISFTNEELLKSGISEKEFTDENYVNAKGYLDGVEYFDAEFFGYSKKEANSMDPQIRLLHMCVWNALEDAGYDPYSYKGKIGLFAGSGSNIAWMTKFLDRKNDSLSAFDAMTMNDKDFLTTKVSYKLNLTGPSINVQTACSTSLVAIHQAVKYLLCNETDIAVAGGVSISYPRKEGYMWNEGMIYSKDGHCRPFSQDSSGTVSGNGCGVVILKKLSKAIQDNDHIYAVIKGSAINNDGIEKIGYTAPSISGEKDVIKRALKQSGISPKDIQYVEAHGTGTELGDPIEIEALKQAWNTVDRQYCAIGSIKANIGHLDAAAGIAGFIKAVQVVKNHTIPPIINFKGINPRIDIKNSPFYINQEKESINSNLVHAAVSAFGIGGTNAHIILEEAQTKQNQENSSNVNIMVFSAKSSSALENTSNKILNYIKDSDNINLYDAAYTLQLGRASFNYRKAYVVVGNKIQNNNSNIIFCDNQNKISELDTTLIVKISNYLLTISDILCQNSNSGVGMLFNHYINETLNELGYNDHIRIESILKGKENGSEEEICIANFILQYTVLKLLIRAGVTPGAVCGDSFGKLCGYVLSETISLATAIEILKSNTKEKFSIEKYPEIDWSDTIIDVIDESDISNYENSYVLNIADLTNNIDDVQLCKLIGTLWTKGFNVDWLVFYKNKAGSKVSLPGYVFDKTVYDSDVVLSDNLTSDFENTETKKQAMSVEEIKSEFEKIWIEVLGVKKQSDLDDFFELGGDSLNAILMTSLIKKRIGVNIQVSDIFSHLKYGEILECLIDKFNDNNIQGNNVDIAILENKPYYETSSAQKRMYAVNQMLPNDLSYNLGSVYCVEGKLDKERLEKTFLLLAERNEAFRTSFGIVDDQVVQFISEDIPQFITFTNASEKNIENEIYNSIKPFDLSKTPLVRVEFISVNDNKHYMIIDMHHIISDQSSIDILMKEFSMLYTGQELPEKKVRYIDFAAWQNKLFKNGEIDKQILYWKNEFADGIPSLDFPTDYPKTQYTSNKGKICNFELDDEYCQKVNSFTKEQHITPYMLMMAALNILLWKYTSKKDIVVGTAVAGRKTSELSDIVGMFVNILPIRTKIDETLNIEDYLQYIKDKMVSAFEAQDCQFEMLLEELNVANNASTHPMFDIVINYVNMGTDEFGIEGLKLSSCVPDSISTKYDLTLTIEENNGKYFMDIEYATDLFENSRIELFGKRFIALLKNIVDNNKEKLKQISIVSKDDMKLINQLNNTKTNSPVEKNVISIFENIVESIPSNTAFVWNDESYTYNEFNRMINIVANMLYDSGVKYKDKVAILLERGPLQVITIFAILKCGAVYVPMDCEYPDNRIEFIIQDSNASVVVTQAGYENKITKSSNRLLIDKSELIQKMNTDSNIACKADFSKLCGDDEAYIIYTSGSTGKPKGTVILHRGIIRTVIDTNYLWVDSNDKILQMANYTFDASVFSIFAALLNGACLVMVPREISLEMPKLAEILKTQKITKALIVTAIFNMLVDYDAAVLKNIDKIYIGGEALSLNHIKKAFKYVGAGHLVNLYGPTEATVCSTHYEINNIDKNWSSVPIGKATSNTSLYVVDELGNILPPNINGELCIGGDGLAKGYLNREDVMKEKFIQLNGERIYRTGDRVTMLSDGNIIYLGRIDSQIKIRGFRIELGEVEHRIADIEGVKDAVVISKKDNMDSLYMVAYYTITGSEYSYITADYIRNELKKQVPEYMVPSRIMHIDKLPITANGKVDRKALPDVVEERFEINRADGVRNETERVILNTMREVLGNPNMGVQDSFFLAGGQSIKAIVFVQRLREMGIELMVNDVFQNPTVEAIANLEQVKSVLGEKSEETTDFKAGIISLNDKQILSVANYVYKSSVMFSDIITDSEIINKFNMAPVQIAHMNSSSNKSGFTVCVNGNNNENSLKNKLAKLIITHQLLHCSIDKNEYKWNEHDVEGLYVLLKQGMVFCDITDYDEQAQTAVLKASFEKLMYSEYDEVILPWRLACFKLSANKIQVIWCFNHCIFDGMSSEILKRQILSNENALMAENVLNYQDYVDILSNAYDNIDEEQIIEKFNLKQWQELNEAVIKKMSELSSKTKEVRIKLPIKNSEENIWSYSYKTAVEILKKYYNQNELPMAIVDYGRKYNGKEFYNCIGEFLDIIPVIADSNSNNIEEGISNLIEMCSENSINFLNLINNPNATESYSRIEKYLGKYLMADKSLDVILYNFQGFISDEEYKLFESTDKYELDNDDSVSRMMVAVNYNNEYLNISLESRDGVDITVIKEILEKKGIRYSLYSNEI